MSSHGEIQMTEEEIATFAARIGKLPDALQDLSLELKIALVKHDYVELSSFPTSDSGWEELRTDCGFTKGKRNTVKNLISPLQQQGKLHSLISSIASTDSVFLIFSVSSRAPIIINFFLNYL